MKSLESKNLSVTIYFEECSLKKKMNYADKLRVENVILIGENEVIENKVKIKNMISGSEISIDYTQLY